MLIFLYILAGYSCSCPPFECMCGLQSNVSAYQQSHHQTTMYPQQTGSNDTPYWLQDTVPAQETALGYNLPSQVSQEASYPDFPPFTGELLQPEEIFQLDQPLRPEFSMNSQEVASRSPPTLLDLGSGTIKYEMKQQGDQAYWSQFLSEDSSSSHLSIAQDERLQFPGFETEKDSANGFCAKRPVNHHQFVPEKEGNHHHHHLNNPLNFQDYQHTRHTPNQKGADQEASYWAQNHQDDRLNFPDFDPRKEEELLPARRDVNCFPKENCQQGLMDRPSYSVYPKKEIDSSRPSISSSRGSPMENKHYSFNDGYQMFDQSDKNQLAANHIPNQSRMVGLDERLQNNYRETNADTSERLFPDPSGMDIPAQNSPEPFFYPTNDRCHYTCEVVDTRLPQMAVASQSNGMNNYGDVADLDLPPFVDYTLVGMLCSTEEDTSSLLPGCPQNSHSYVPHH